MKTKISLVPLCLLLTLSLTACNSDDDQEATAAGEVPLNSEAPVNESPAAKTFQLQQGSDNNRKASTLLSLNPGGPGGSPNQSLRAGDVLTGNQEDDILIGGLGVDVLLGYDGDDILIGGTEDFNSNVDGDDAQADNRDRALGQGGDDVFIWAPGDGSDFFDGGEGTDVVIFGILAESRDAQGATDGAPFFAVNPPGTDGSQDFDGIFLNDNSQPRVSASNSPGFCSLVDRANNEEAFDLLDVDQIVRFSLRGVANAFDNGERSDDDGLRVAVTLKNTEYVVCTRRDFNEGGGLENVEVLDLSQGTPLAASLEDLPAYVQDLIQ